MSDTVLHRIGRWTLARVVRLGHASLFLYELAVRSWRWPGRPGPAAAKALRLVVHQLYSVGVLTLAIVLVSSVFVGMVLGLQGYNTLVDFGAESSLGLLVALSLTRELGPVVTALLFAGRAGSALTAEIGLMKATEQLAGMEMMAVNPMTRVIAPRFVAGLVSLPTLAAMFTLLGIYGGYFVGVIQLGVDEGVFWSQMQDRVDFYDDVVNGLIKGVVFGFVVSWIAVFEGYDCVPTSAGVSAATTRTVVSASLAVLGLDFVMTALMMGED